MMMRTLPSDSDGIFFDPGAFGWFLRLLFFPSGIVTLFFILLLVRRSHEQKEANTNNNKTDNQRQQQQQLETSSRTDGLITTTTTTTTMNNGRRTTIVLRNENGGGNDNNDIFAMSPTTSTAAISSIGAASSSSSGIITSLDSKSCGGAMTSLSVFQVSVSKHDFDRHVDRICSKLKVERHLQRELQSCGRIDSNSCGYCLGEGSGGGYLKLPCGHYHHCACVKFALRRGIVKCADCGDNIVNLEQIIERMAVYPL